MILTICGAIALVCAPAEADEGALAARGLRLPAGLQAELFAAEPLLSNPVAFWIDERGRIYVAETFRLHAGVTDNRMHMYWVDDDLAARTVEDRVALYFKHDPNASAVYGTAQERIKLVIDTDGDGKADQATVFADGFNDPADGLGAGLLSRGGDVYFTCIPRLWLLRDRDQDGVAEERQVLHDGFGVHVAFLGHDLHGLRIGPDGRLYFSVGDRGFNVKTAKSLLAMPDTGAVFRCDLDGSNLEVFASGLRNPQELAFNELGDLFTGENNSDGGDRARWVHLVEGSDSGWRMSYQYLDAPVSRGPWNAEKLWLPRWEGQAAYILPPLANLGDGPSGLAFYPGTGLPSRYDNHFFLCDFRGVSGMSGLRSFALEPEGASYRLVDEHEAVWNVLATDCDFGPDSALYVSDWVTGWEKTGKGRIYKVFDPILTAGPEVAEVKRLLTEGFDHRDVIELTRHLDHRDQRIRQESQFALAAKGLAALPALFGVARQGGGPLGKIHAVWALGQIARREREVTPSLFALLDHPESEVRGQAAKTLGDLHALGARTKLVALLQDPAPRVQHFAALALSKVGKPQDVGPLCELLRANADRDLFVRHAAVMGLGGQRDPSLLLPRLADPSPSVRLGVLLALRRQQDPGVALCLEDPSPAIVVEAARAIYDVPIPAALPQLAALPLKSAPGEPLGWRVINANFRLGTGEAAQRLAALAARPDLADNLRAEALQALAAWPKPSGRDRLLGDWRPVEPRSAESRAAPALALEAVLPGILGDAPDAVRLAAMDAASQLQMPAAVPQLQALFATSGAPGGLRARALTALESLRVQNLVELAKQAARDSVPEVRIEGQRLLSRLSPTEAMPLLAKAFKEGTTTEQQAALAALGEIPSPDALTILDRAIDDLLAGATPAAIQLDILEAAERQGTPALRARLELYEAKKPADDPLGKHREALHGGNALRGARVFFEKKEVSCQRCHKTHRPGGEVGPNLADLGARETREHILESLVAPNSKIAKGFDSITVVTQDGKVINGVLRQEDEKSLQIVTAEDTLLTVDKADIQERSVGVSAMPEDLMRFLSRRELRDLVEYLTTLKNLEPLK